MMKYRLFLSDFDGTLVRADGTVSEANKNAIARYVRAGGIFAVCTGRMLSSILPRVRGLGLREGLVVAYQGATVADIATGRLIKNDAFDLPAALSAIRVLEAGGHHIHVYTVENMYANMRDEMLSSYERTCGVTGVVVEDELLSEKAERENMRVVKILAMVEPQSRFELRDELCAVLGKGYYVTCSSEWLVEIMPEGQSKGEAVSFLSDYYSVPFEQIAAIGDQLNDIPMLERAGGKFTVKNGQPELKKIAKEMPSNEDDGVAEAILKYAMGETP